MDFSELGAADFKDLIKGPVGEQLEGLLARSLQRAHKEKDVGDVAMLMGLAEAIKEIQKEK